MSEVTVLTASVAKPERGERVIRPGLHTRLLPLFDAPITHPARYSRDLFQVFRQYVSPEQIILDPFGGVGHVTKLGARAVVHEIERTVVVHAAGSRRVCGNAIALPFAADAFDAVVTSPTYGNRMADKFTDGSKRNTYTAGFGIDLHPGNSGAMQWGGAYRELHRSAWAECWRVLCPGGLFLLNVSDHIRNGERVYVSKWHLTTLRSIGFCLLKTHTIKTPRNRFGANGAARCPVEYVFVLQKADG